MLAGVHGRLYALYMSVVLLSLAGCRKPAPAESSGPPRNESAPEATVARDDPQRLPELELIKLKLEVEQLYERGSWLRVDRADAGVPGAWVSGGFNPVENKIFIDTHDVSRFTVDLERVPVQWSRLVVLRIDGRNTELKRREKSRYHFARDDHGQWVVEP